jgi:hypothetical protein
MTDCPRLRGLGAASPSQQRRYERKAKPTYEIKPHGVREIMRPQRFAVYAQGATEPISVHGDYGEALAAVKRYEAGDKRRARS